MVDSSPHTIYPLISVITVCYNEPPEKIRFTFSSIASQTFAGIEWIVIDGGSDNETLSAIGEFSDKIQMLISEPDDGIYYAMNKGIKNAHGDFLIFMNVGDRFADSSTLSSMTTFIIGNPGYDCYYGNELMVDPTSGTTYFDRQVKKVNRFHLHYRNMDHQATLSSKALYDRIGVFDVSYRLSADKEWAVRSIANGAKWKHTGITVCEYEIGGFSYRSTKIYNEEPRIIRQYYNLPERALYYLAKKIRGLWLRPMRICRHLMERHK